MGKRTRELMHQKRNLNEKNNVKRIGKTLAVAAAIGFSSLFLKPSLDKLLDQPLQESPLLLEHPYTPKSTTIGFQAALQNPSLRQEYLNQLVSLNELTGCQGIVYDHDGREMISFIKGLQSLIPNLKGSSNAFTIGGEYMMETPIILQVQGNKIAIPIFVGNGAFKNASSDAEMRVAILYNEGSHTRQMYSGSPYFTAQAALIANPQLLKIVNELESSANTITAVKKYQISVSPHFLEIDITDYKGYYAELKKWKPQNPTEKDIIERATKGLPKPNKLINYEYKQ